MAIGYHLVFKVGFKVAKHLFCVLLRKISKCNKSPTSTRPHNYFLIFSSSMFNTIHNVISVPLCLCMQYSSWCGFFLLCILVHVATRCCYLFLYAYTHGIGCNVVFIPLCLSMWCLLVMVLLFAPPCFL
jgi:hypothetical protein